MKLYGTHIIIKGKYAEAIVLTNEIEEEAISQIKNIVDQPMMEGVNVRIMPDVHAGAGICIGYTATMNDYIVPNFIGVDIGCGVTALYLPYSFGANLQYDIFDKVVRGNIPSGMNVNDSVDEQELKTVFQSLTSSDKHDYTMDYSDFTYLVKEICNKIKTDYTRAIRSIGSLGGGNHFISINLSPDGHYHLIVHSGSRNFGKTVAEYWQSVAKKNCAEEGVCKNIEYLTGRDAAMYLADTDIAQIYAALNRRVILYRLTSKCKQDYNRNYLTESVHNYIDTRHKIIRKGAISAYEGEDVLIPLSMADGILYGKGKGNTDWNCSAPHGAGRLMSRSKAKKTITLEEYQRRMKEAGVWTSCVNEETLDESPQAYKDPTMIINTVKDTVEIQGHWKEVYNFKAC